MEAPRVRTTFLGARAACLPLAAAWMAGVPRESLPRTLVVTPGRRAGRRLRHLLAESMRGPVVPPHFCTVGELPERLAPGDPATRLSPVAAELLWLELLQAPDPEAIAELLRRPPPRHRIEPWLAIARDLRRIQIELSGAGFSFADLAERLEDDHRWKFLAALEAAFDHACDSMGWWDAPRRRREMVGSADNSGPLFASPIERVVLVGCLDPPPIYQELLSRWPGAVDVLIHAEAGDAAGYGPMGEVIAEYWSDRELSIEPTQLTVVQQPRDQVEAILDLLESPVGAVAADELSLVVSRAADARALARRLQLVGLPARPATGRPLEETGPVSLLQLTAAFLEEGDRESFAALVRHSDLETWLRSDPEWAKRDWLPLLDLRATRELPADAATLCSGEPLAGLRERILSLLAPFAGPARPAAEWSETVRDLLVAVYTDAPIERHAHPDLVAAMEGLRDLLRDLIAYPRPVGPWSGAEMLRFVVEMLRRSEVPLEADAGSVDVIGWLEVALDDAPVLCCAGLEEGLVPENVRGDVLIPNGVRQLLGLNDNRQRYARDAAILHAKLQSCRRLQIIVCRSDDRGDPVTPSRLLFACPPETVVERVRQLYPRELAPAVQRRPLLEPGQPNLWIPSPIPREATPTRPELSVTEFRAYLRCPYRYYLEHVEGLRELEDRAEELGPAEFGELAHQVMGAFGRGAVRDSRDPALILEFLEVELERVAAKRFGVQPLASVELQLHQLRRRLTHFSHRQAELRAEGWRLMPEWCERDLTADLPRSRVQVRGRIDRVDVHESSGRYRLMDYKTADSATSPDRGHFLGSGMSRDWIDLQLPLYDLLFRQQVDKGSEIELGYFNLPAEVDSTGFHPAGWGPEEVQDGVHQAVRVADCIIGEQFRMVRHPPGGRDYPYASLCLERYSEAVMAADRETGLTLVPKR